MPTIYFRPAKSRKEVNHFPTGKQAPLPPPFDWNPRPLPTVGNPRPNTTATTTRPINTPPILPPMQTVGNPRPITIDTPPIIVLPQTGDAKTKKADQLGAPIKPKPDETRLIVFEGTATWNQYFGDYFNLPPVIDSHLRAAGQLPGAIRVNKQALFGNQLNFEIELNVYNRYTAEQARNNLQIDLSRLTGHSFLYGDYPVFTNVSLRIVKDFQTTSNGSGVFNPTPKQTQAAKETDQITQDLLKDKGDGTDFFSSFGKSLGLTTPFALVGAGLLFLIILRK